MGLVWVAVKARHMFAYFSPSFLCMAFLSAQGKTNATNTPLQSKCCLRVEGIDLGDALAFQLRVYFLLNSDDTSSRCTVMVIAMISLPLKRPKCESPRRSTPTAPWPRSAAADHHSGPVDCSGRARLRVHPEATVPWETPSAHCCSSHHLPPTSIRLDTSG